MALFSDGACVVEGDVEEDEKYQRAFQIAVVGCVIL
jgi:hypothetical protein